MCEREKIVSSGSQRLGGGVGRGGKVGRRGGGDKF